MKKALSYLLIFIGIQLVGGAIVTNLWSLIQGSSDKTAAMLITTTGVVCHLSGYAHVHGLYSHGAW